MPHFEGVAYPMAETMKGERMAVRPVLRMGDPLLLQVAKPVETFDTAELRELLVDMHDTMAALNGAGLTSCVPPCGDCLTMTYRPASCGRDSCQ